MGRKLFKDTLNTNRVEKGTKLRYQKKLAVPEQQGSEF